MKKNARADLHLHSKHSAQAADWVLRKLDFPASCAEPSELYETCVGKRGMNFFTITDHNTIEGCLRVAERPGVFLSEEVFAHFPEDHCKVHLLVYGINERDHEDIQAARSNLYHLQALLFERQIAHAVAHPLHGLDEKFTPTHFKKLVLLFRHFEGINGKYAKVLSEAAQHILRGLTEEKIVRFAEETGLEPTHGRAWEKVFVGGSDDSAGLFAGETWTEVGGAGDAAAFLRAVREGECGVGGEAGNPSRMAHASYKTAFSFAKSKFELNSKDPGIHLLEKGFNRFMEGKDPTEFSVVEKLGFLAHGIASGKIFEIAKAGQNSLWKELSAYFSQPAMKASLARATSGVEEPERRAFLMAELVSGQLAYRFFCQFIQQISSGKILESIQTVAPLVPLAALLSPYLHAFRMTPRKRLRAISLAVAGDLAPCLENKKRAWFTDTLDDINGVATTIQKMAAAGVAAGHDIVVVTSRPEVSIPGVPVQNFPPVGDFELPEYELQRLSFPPVLLILDWLVQEGVSEVIISTPGPMGLTALLAAELLGLPSVSIYHTDFPQYVGILTDDAFMETLTWNFMRWFYSRQEIVYVNSEDYRHGWVQRGIPAERLRILPRGLDTVLFHPSKKKESFWRERGLRDDEVGVLFVGRISKEKNLDILVAASREIERKGGKIRFLFVGDGPYLKEMKVLIPDAIFTGALGGETLATAYASAHIFAFPSTTDTFGNVIIEAQACGLPCVVSDMGGPRDLVANGEDGFVTRALDVGELTAAILALAGDGGLRGRMGAAARAKVETRDWAKAFEVFWSASE